MPSITTLVSAVQLDRPPGRKPELFTGTVIPLAESYKKRERTFYADVKDKWVTISAWGDWAKFVPDGMIGVCATVGHRLGDGAAEGVLPEERLHAAGLARPEALPEALLIFRPEQIAR